VPNGKGEKVQLYERMKKPRGVKPLGYFLFIDNIQNGSFNSQEFLEHRIHGVECLQRYLYSGEPPPTVLTYPAPIYCAFLIPGILADC
jgi:hypothetical protein